MEDTLFLIASARRAKIVEVRDAERIETLVTFSHPQARTHGIDVERDRPPRVHDRIGPHRHAIEPRTPARDREYGRFADEIVAELERLRTTNRLHRLVVVAPPRFLGALRARFRPPLGTCVTASKALDATRFGPDALRGLIAPQEQHPVADSSAYAT